MFDEQGQPSINAMLLCQLLLGVSLDQAQPQLQQAARSRRSSPAPGSEGSSTGRQCCPPDMCHHFSILPIISWQPGRFIRYCASPMLFLQWLGQCLLWSVCCLPQAPSPLQLTCRLFIRQLCTRRVPF